MLVCSGVDGAMAMNEWPGDPAFSEVWPKGIQHLSCPGLDGELTVQRASWVQQLPKSGRDTGGIPGHAVVEGEARSSWVGKHFTPPALLAVFGLVLVRVHGRDGRS